MDAADVSMVVNAIDAGFIPVSFYSLNEKLHYKFKFHMLQNCAHPSIPVYNQ